MRLLFFLFPIFLFSDYEEDLTKAYVFYLDKNWKLSREKLQKIDLEYELKDWRFYSLKGEIEEQLGETTEALKNYTIAVSLNQTNSELFKRIYEIYTNLKKPFHAFEYIRLYLSQNPYDTRMRYKAMLLSKRIGEDKYFEFSKNKFNSESIPESEFINLELKLKQKKYNELETNLTELKYKYPFEVGIYNLEKKIFLETKNKTKLEENFLEQAILFESKERVILELANFYKEEKKYLKALNLYRKYFFLSLKKEKIFEANIFLKEIYRSLNKNDFLAFDELEDFFLVPQKLLQLKRLSITYPNQREILILGIYFSKKEKNETEEIYFQNKLKARDEKNEFSELLNVYSLFLKEDLF